MKTCTKCSHNNEDNAKFCVKCGEGLEAQHKAQSQIEIETMQCAKCGYNNKKGVKFCGNCGSSLAQDSKKIKRFFGWLLGLFGIVVLVSVFSINIPVKESTYLNVSHDEIGFFSDGQADDPSYGRYHYVVDTCWIDVDTDGAYDVIHSGWLKIKKRKKGIVVTCLPNIMKERKRKDSIQVVSGNFTSTINVSQDYGVYVATKVEDSEIEIGPQGGKIRVKVYTNLKDWDKYIEGFVSSRYSYRSYPVECKWIEVDVLQKKRGDEEDALVFNIARNNGEKREAVFNFDRLGDQELLIINQDKGYSNKKQYP